MSTSEVNTEVVATQPFVFRKKQKVKDGNLRTKKLDDTDDAGSEEIKQVDLDMVKAQQALREKSKRIPSLLEDTQISSSSLNYYNYEYYRIISLLIFFAEEKKSKKEDQITLGAQFSVQIDNGYGPTGGIQHEKLMNQYINEKLGISKNAIEVKEKPAYLIEEEKLYKVPDYIKVNFQNSISKEVLADGDEGIKSSWSTGIAEVALPVSFKLKNIEQTELLLKQKQINIPDSNSEGPVAATAVRTAIDTFTSRPSYYQRFQRADQSFSASAKDPQLEILYQLDQQNLGVATMTDSTIPTANTTAVNNASTVTDPPSSSSSGPLKKSQRSTDDIAMARFKKQQMQHRR